MLLKQDENSGELMSIRTLIDYADSSTTNTKWCSDHTSHWIFQAKTPTQHTNDTKVRTILLFATPVSFRLSYETLPESAEHITEVNSN